MKRILLVCVAGLIVGFAHGQKLKESEVPADVKTAFGKKFAAAKDVKWSKEGTSEFEAEFKNGALEQAANFDGAGKWLVTETEIKKTELPKAVQAGVAKEFAGFKIEEVEKVESPDKPLLYEMEVEKNKVAYEVQFSADGKMVKKDVKKEAKEEKD